MQEGAWGEKQSTESAEGNDAMTEDREKTEQEKLNERVRKHMEFMKGLGFLAKYVGCLLLVMGGFFLLLQTKGAFGDVPLVLGVLLIVWLFKAEG